MFLNKEKKLKENNLLKIVTKRCILSFNQEIIAISTEVLPRNMTLYYKRGKSPMELRHYCFLISLDFEYMEEIFTYNTIRQMTYKSQ